MITDISIVGLEHRYKIIEKILWLLLLNYLVPDSTCTHLGRFVGQSDPFGCLDKSHVAFESYYESSISL